MGFSISKLRNTLYTGSKYLGYVEPVASVGKDPSKLASRLMRHYAGKKSAGMMRRLGLR